MKRDQVTNDPEWKIQLKARKELAATRMLEADLRAGFVTIPQMVTAANYWSISQHEAETRLLTGYTIPDDLIQLLLKGS